MQSTAALPFGTIVIILLIWALITIPLTIAGGIVGKNTRTEFKATCRTNKCAFPLRLQSIPRGLAACSQEASMLLSQVIFSRMRLEVVVGQGVKYNLLGRSKRKCMGRYPREIPELPWYRHAVPQMIMAGFLPFSAIYIEL